MLPVAPNSSEFPSRPRLPVHRDRFHGECQRRNRTLRLRGRCQGGPQSRIVTMWMRRPSHKCADIVGLCAFYDKCARPGHGNVAKIMAVVTGAGC
jgi:hypothetical protein